MLEGIKKAAGWVAPTLNKVLRTLAGPVSTLHPGVGAVMGIGSRLASGVTIRKCQDSWREQRCINNIVKEAYI
ncbi:MAG: hypothetical protein EZS28_026023 [Streblomastix strix]|uniref:Uncharacterized protein n=1 Tax=Streblomastix strix TaxID=222440 RepID=A0A5J4V7N4_9EUKA|nr:MAG: hypothetical protein EZS28_026023 [Streblomastix strix]